MAQVKVKRPALHQVFEQWRQRAERRTVNNNNNNNGTSNKDFNDIDNDDDDFDISYRILFQCDQSYQTRNILASSLFLERGGKSSKKKINDNNTIDGTSTQLLYRRAGVRTPTETATRDFMGGYLWMSHLLQTLLNMSNNDDNSDNQQKQEQQQQQQSLHVIWVQTNPNSEIMPDIDNKTSNLTIINTTNYTTMGINLWESNQNDKVETEDNVMYNWNNLSDISNCIKSKINEKKIVAVLVESITPLLMKFGLEETTQFINDTLKNCLSVISIRRELLTPRQHALLEDNVQALLWLHNGEMTLMRQGIREEYNVLRESIPFSIAKKQDTTTKRLEQSSFGSLYYIVEHDDDVDDDIMDNDTKNNDIMTVADRDNQIMSSTLLSTSDEHNYHHRHQQHLHAQTTTTKNKSSSSSSQKIQLRLEEDEETKNDKNDYTVTAPTRRPDQPIIYVQDDDPEFDDLDEEDPDDDLDI